MDTDLLSQIGPLARVPEHSSAFMEAVSQGTAFTQGAYFFLAADDWLMAVAYPLRGKYRHETFEAALRAALERTGAVDCWAVGPDLPPRLRTSVVDRDRFYLLSAGAPIPAKLHSPLRRASGALRVEEGRTFTPAHRRLWAEFMGRAALKPNVRELYARTEDVLNAPGTDLRLLNAWDAQGRLAACLLMDYAPEKFCSYILGAHSREHAVPHASDLLFVALLDSARRGGKRYVHLGLGVNEGIRRFKTKWGGRPYLPYQMAEWREAPRAAAPRVDTFLLTLARAGLEDLCPGPQDDARPEQRRFGMLWEVEKNGKTSWIGGTAHFFCYSFDRSFRKLFRKADTVVFEGPLDEETLAAVELAGKTPPPGLVPLATLMTEEEIRTLQRVVRGPEGRLARWLNMEAPRKTDVRWYLEHTRPWCAFFSLWTGFLELQGWRQSVDLEAWHLARSMGKTVLGMETMEEQVAVLDAVPVERILRYFRNCRQWKHFVRRNVRAYLSGDLGRMIGSGAEFPTRTEQVIGARDQRFRERMRPFLEAGRCVVFVGSAHMINLRSMLAEDGFRIRRYRPTLRHRLRSWWHLDAEARW